MSADVGTAVVILHVDQSSYFDTEGVGADLWRRLELPVRVQTLVDDLVTTYAVSADNCQRDVLSFLEQALSEGIIRVSTGTD